MVSVTDFETPDPISGVRGELLERLIMALRVNLDTNSMIVWRLGIDLGLTRPKPWDIDAFLSELRQIVSALLEINFFEGFIVRSIRDSVMRSLTSTSFASVDENRAGMKAYFERILTDDEALADYQSRVADRTPEGERESDEEVRARLANFIESPLLAPVSADLVTDTWAAEERWREASSYYLSDEDIETWTDRAPYSAD